ncbi:hypothetical protein BO71DRAFT_434256 [Aspergillus ellipticus CBS 707.79]|uniref:Uncharacterized protein n=1 Tax=Aspergillus ellipticus CBS 707.79 TaxID=1448320 RepID=A0A319EGF9_9EURO|nr:hypothetical protein BO71DRAFT_434256 [Aspergillus ellipticus CBS 707.79]
MKLEEDEEKRESVGVAGRNWGRPRRRGGQNVGVPVTRVAAGPASLRASSAFAPSSPFPPARRPFCWAGRTGAILPACMLGLARQQQGSPYFSRLLPERVIPSFNPRPAPRAKNPARPSTPPTLPPPQAEDPCLTQSLPRVNKV